MDDRGDAVEVTLPNGAVISVEIVGGGGPSDVAGFKSLDFNEVQGVIVGLAGVIGEAMQKVSPRSARVELGLNFKAEAGHLTSILVKGGGGASLKLALTWERGLNGSGSGNTEVSEAARTIDDSTNEVDV